MIPDPYVHRVTDATCGHSQQYIDKLGRAGYYREGQSARICVLCGRFVIDHHRLEQGREEMDQIYDPTMPKPDAPRGTRQTMIELEKRVTILDEAYELLVKEQRNNRAERAGAGAALAALQEAYG